MKTHTIEYLSSFTPVYYLRGARLQILDLAPEYGGRMDGILLNREGDCAILPIQTYITNNARKHRREQTDPETIALTLADLQRNGWENFGRITITFIGADGAE